MEKKTKAKNSVRSYYNETIWTTYHSINAVWTHCSIANNLEKLQKTKKVFRWIVILLILINFATVGVCFYRHHLYVNEIIKIDEQNNITTTIKKERKDHLRNKISFWDSIVAGVILGCPFVIIAIYYFYNNILRPLQTNDREAVMKYGDQSINAPMSRWFFPPLIFLPYQNSVRMR